MGTFDPDWLALREPADVAARSARLTRLVGEALQGRAVLRALDLATGTGANVRYLTRGERLPWYPSARLFRQIAPGRWESPIAGVGDALRAKLAA